MEQLNMERGPYERLLDQQIEAILDGDWRTLFVLIKGNDHDVDGDWDYTFLVEQHETYGQLCYRCWSVLVKPPSLFAYLPYVHYLCASQIENSGIRNNLKDRLWQFLEPRTVTSLPALHENENDEPYDEVTDEPFEGFTREQLEEFKRRQLAAWFEYTPPEHPKWEGEFVRP